MTLPPKWAADGEGFCRSCEVPVVWAVHDESGRRAPFDLDGTPHFATCPDAKAWRKDRQARKKGDVQ